MQKESGRLHDEEQERFCVEAPVTPLFLPQETCLEQKETK